MSRKSKLLRRLVRCRCLRGEEETVSTIDYSHCCLQQVPKDVFLFERTLEELYLDANQLEDLPKQLFGCVLLHKLSISDNDISILPLSIANLVNLHELDISKNGIQEIPENIKSCKLLTTLEASVNPISKLPEGATQLTNLTELYLNDAFLETLPASMGRLAKLRVLELRENHLRTLPQSMNEMSQLERLDLGSNEISEWPSVLEHMVVLKELWMDGNQLQALPSGLGSLKRLSYLDASKNQVETMDPGVAGCEALEDLHLSSNMLCQLPDEIGCLKSLTTLKVDDNQLSLLPEALGDLDSLEELDCSGNQLERFPPSIGRLANLRTLTADENHFFCLPPEIGNCKNVTVLSLRSNRLETLPSEMGSMTHLRVLNLSDNRLKFLPISFTSLKELSALWLSDNQSKPLIQLQVDGPTDDGERVLTNYMFPQQARAPDVEYKSESESFNAELWEQQRQQRSQVAFECDDQREERDPDTVKEGTLKRYPTPYPEELKNLVKTAQSVVNKIHSDGATAAAGSGTARAATSKEALSAPTDTGKTTGSHPPDEGLAEGESRGGPTSSVDGGTGQAVSQAGPIYSTSSTVTNTTVIVNHYTQESEEDSDEEEEQQAKEEARSEEEETKPFLSEPQRSMAQSSQLSALSQPMKRAEGAVPLSIGLDLDYNSNRNNSNGLSLVQDLPLPPAADDNVLGSVRRQAEEGLSDQTKSSPKGISTQSAAAEATGSIGAVKVNGTAFASGRPVVPAKPSVLYSAKTESVALTQSKGAAVPAPQSEPLPHDEPRDPAFVPSSLAARGQQQADAGAVPNQPAVSVGGCVAAEADVATSPERSDAGMLATASTARWEDSERERSRELPSGAGRAPLPSLARSNSANAAETAPSGGCTAIAAAAATTAAGENAADVGISRSLSAPLLDDERIGRGAQPAVPTKHVIYHFDSDFSPRSQRSQVLAAQQQQQQYGHGAQDRYAKQPPPPLRPAGDPQFVFTSRHSSASSLPRTPVGGGQQFGYRCVDVPPGDGADYGSAQGQRRGGLDRQGSVTSTGSDASGAAGYAYVGYARGVPHSESDYMSPRDAAAMSRGAPYVAAASGRPVSARSYTLDSGFYTQAHGQGGRPQSARPGPQHLPVGGRERAPSDADPRAGGAATPVGGQAGARARSEHSLLAGIAGSSGARTPPPADWREQLLRHVENRMLEKGSSGPPGSPFDPSGGPPRGWGTVGRGDGGGGAVGGGGAANWATMGRPGGAGHVTVDGPAYGARHAARDYNRYPSQPLLSGPMGGCDDSFGAGRPGDPGVSGVTGTLSRKDVPPDTLKPLSLPNGAPYRGPPPSQMARHPSREELIDFLVQRQTMRTPTQGLQVLHRVPGNPHANGYHQESAARRPEGCVEEVVVLIEKNPGLGFSISGGTGGQGGPFSPSNMGIFVTRVQPDGPAASLLRPGDRIVKANGYSFTDMAHERAVALLKSLENPVELVVRR